MEDLSEIYKSYADEVKRFLICLTTNVDLAEELTQETFYQAVKSIDRYNGECKMSVWLCQIAKHTYYNHLKKAKRYSHNSVEQMMEMGLDVPSNAAPPEVELAKRITFISLHREIHLLKEPYREIFLLRTSVQLSFKEIGEIFDKSENWASIHHCEKCRKYLEMMEQPTNTSLPEEVMVAKAPFKKINKKRRIQVVISILITFIITIIGSLVVQEVGVVNDFFFPMNMTTVNVTDEKEEWNKVYFDNKEYFKFDSIFWNKEIVNHANNNSEVLLRIKDANGHVVVVEFHIPPGKSKKLEGLKKNVNYYLEIKAKKGQFFINVV